MFAELLPLSSLACTLDARPGKDPSLMTVRSLAVPLTCCLLLAAGCNSASSPQPETPPGAPGAASPIAPSRPAQASHLNSAREQLDQIPPPSKSRYLAIHTVDSWSNPFLIVSKKNVTLRIYYPDPVANGTMPGSVLPNTMLRPSGARKRELDLRLSDLPEALAALPQESWGYGRVIAVEEDPSTIRPDRPQMRRNLEAAIQMLNDLGVVVYEWSNGGVFR